MIKHFTKGLWKEIPPFRLVLGLCPTLAVTTSAFNGIGMGLACTFVLLCSNVLISMLRNVIPKKVRIASYIVIIATFVVIVELMMKFAFYDSLHKSLGIFIALIVVNCIILGRAEAFASKNSIIPSALDGLGMGIGYTMALTVLATFREILGKGTITYGPDISAHVLKVMGVGFEPFTLMVLAPGAFVCLGLLLAVMNTLGD